MSDEVLISLRGISKSFAGVQALSNIDIDIIAGKVHGLIGANGAGKSTLVKILAGVYQPDEGVIIINKRPEIIQDPSASTSLGMSFIHQELNLVPSFNVVENLSLGIRKDSKFGLIDWSKTVSKFEEVLKLVGFKKSPYTPIRDLSVR